MHNVGTLRRDPATSEYVITCEPHVTIRLKRVFPRIAKGSAGEHRLRDTPETAAELEWFMQRFPFDVQAPEQLAARAAEHRETETVVHAILNGLAPSKLAPLAIELREYQQIAAAAALATGGILIGDDLGLGKSASAIGVIADPRARPAVVVTVTSLPRQWAREIKRFAPALHTHIVSKGTPYDMTLGPRGKACAKRHSFQADTDAAGGARCGWCGLTRDDVYHGRTKLAVPDVVIVNYAKLAGWAETLATFAKSVVWDEVQELRKNDSDKASAARHLAKSVSFRVGLSATPVMNWGAEYFNASEVVRPGALGSYEEFVREWCTFSDRPDKARLADPRAFGQYVRSVGLLIRRTRADVAREIPALTKSVQVVSADESAINEVGKACAELARTILKQGQAHKAEKLHASEEFSNRLRQATGIAKAPYVADFVRLVLESEARVILLGWHRVVYDIWIDRLSDTAAGDLKPVLYTGSESASQKEKNLEAFMRGDSRVLIMSLRSGAGLDGLQHACRTTIHGELDWSPKVHAQCDGRVHRDGQPDPVIAYYCMAETGSDPIVADILLRKRMQADGIMNPDEDYEVLADADEDESRIKRLAGAWLTQRGEAIPNDEGVAAE